MVKMFVTDYSEVKLTRILNSELADTYGNLLSRCCAPVLNPNQICPPLDPESFECLLKEFDVTQQLIDKVEALPGKTLVADIQLI